MILNTGTRTDIPAFYSEWFYNRIREGYVMVRNPYYPHVVLRYQLSPKAIDCLAFCTKNPLPMLPRLGELQDYAQFWLVTITPYGQDIEPHVPAVNTVISSFQQLAKLVGITRIGWRYDPVIITPKYSLEFHIQAFATMAKALQGYTDHCIISFLRLYAKTQRNFPEAREVSTAERRTIGKEFVAIGKQYGMEIRSCITGNDLADLGVNCSGCMSKAVIERALAKKLIVPARTSIREGCDCLLGNDIGAYNTCGHGCRYCYANYDQQTVEANMWKHDPNSPFLLGNLMEGDIIREVKQASYIDQQLDLL